MKPGRRLLVLSLLFCLPLAAVGTTRYVNLNSLAPTSPYTAWSTAATNIQNAVDVASSGDVILVTNGTYRVGSRTAGDSTPCRVVINKPVTVRSVNGPDATVIEGFSLPGSFPWSPNSVRCAYMTNGATLVGFTLSKGSVLGTTYVNIIDLGGGVYCTSTSAVVSNCVLIGCAAYAGGGAHGGSFFHCLITNCLGHIGGGGAESAMLDRCQVVWNTSDYYAGGLYICQATNCIIIDNLGLFGGGADGGSISQCTVMNNYAGTSAIGDGGYGGGLNNVDARNSIIYYNHAAAGGDDIVTGTYTNCCCASVLAGTGNITNAPLFVDVNYFPPNLHLQSNSPCINAGSNTFVSLPKDLDGRTRIIGPKVDMGAYEFQSGDTNAFVNWLWDYYLSTDIAADSEDSDGDGMNNWQEWKADTVPVDPSSYLFIGSLEINPTSDIVGWASVNTRRYTVLSSTNFGAASPFTKIATNILGQSGATYYTNNNIVIIGSCLYRIQVE